MKRFFLVLSLLAALPAAPETVGAAERAGTVTFDIAINAPASAKKVRLWFPYPTSTLTQKIENLRFDGNYSGFTLSREPRSGALYLFTEWLGPRESRTLKVTFLARAKDQRAGKLEEANAPLPAEARRYLEADFWVPSDDPKVRSLAREITAGKTGILAKARAVYDWTVENTRRNPEVPGCGLGNVQATLSSRSGKCADISSVFVALARASGVPAREVFGIRLGQPGVRDITDGHHCWAEFYLPGSGWIPVDPADVRKVMLRDNLDLAAASRYREYFFGSVDEFRIVLQKGGRGISFAERNAEKVNYFMYPYCEVDDRPIDYCRPREFRYNISFREAAP